MTCRHIQSPFLKLLVVLALPATAALLPISGRAETEPTLPVVVGEAVVYRQSHVAADIRCDGAPVVLAGNHTRLHLTGECRRVRVAGAHNDVFVEVSAGAVIEITGAHNDVTWIPRNRAARPTLADRGTRNTFHFAQR